MILQDAILKKVIKFRRLVGFEGQENSVHERLYASESIELLTAESHAETADALADMAVVMAGHYLNGYPFYNFEKAIKGLENQAILNNVNLLAAFDIVMISNMSKVCLEADKNATTQKYLSEGVRLHWVDRDGQSACYSAEEYPDKPKGKLLKPVTYKKPDWSVSGWKILPINEHYRRPILRLKSSCWTAR